MVLSGVYPDEDDQGDVVIYTGQGGLERGTQRAVADQPLNRGNAALILNLLNRCAGPRDSPCRREISIRRALLRRSLFRERFCNGHVFLMARDELRRIAPATVAVLRDAAEPSGRIEQTVLRIVRQTALARTVKEMYDYTCQVCEVSLPTAAGPYAEAAHIRPLGLAITTVGMIYRTSCVYVPMTMSSLTSEASRSHQRRFELLGSGREKAGHSPSSLSITSTRSTSTTTTK